MKQVINRLLGRVGAEVVPLTQSSAARARYRRAVEQLEHAMRAGVAPSIPDTPNRLDFLANLIGTDPAEAVFLLDALHRGLRVSGDICEFGVAQGATSALVANELVHHGGSRSLWLFDSFQGLPAPTEGDELIDDIEQLGSMAAYAGRMAMPRAMVEARLGAVSGWSGERTKIVEGYFDPQGSPLPDQVSFAYVDFDLYQPIADVLAALHTRLQRGSMVMVDDYGFFSAGAQRAVDEFVAAHPEDYDIVTSPSYSGAFALLERK